MTVPIPGTKLGPCTIDHYGRLPDTTLTAIRQAVRFARRTVGEDASPA